MKRPRILLADDHRMVAEGLRGLLEDEFELAGIVEDGHVMLIAADEMRPDVIVADITMPHLNGLDALPTLRKKHPRTKVVFLTQHQDAAYARRAPKRVPRDLWSSTPHRPSWSWRFGRPWRMIPLSPHHWPVRCSDQ